MRHRLWPAAVCLALGCVAFAAVTSDEADVREQLFKLQKDTARLLDGLAKLDVAVKQQQTSPACAEAASRAESLETQMRAVLEAIAASQARLDEALAEIRALRLSSAASGSLRPAVMSPPATNGAPSESPPIAGPPAVSNAPPGEPGISPTDAFHAAYADYSRRLYDLALDGFQRSLAADPKGPLADDAQYWIGETLLAQGKTADAIAAFDKVITGWPNGEKRLAAEVRKGVALVEFGHREEGASLLQKAIDGHPGTPEAQSAREFLRRKGLAR